MPVILKGPRVRDDVLASSASGLSNGDYGPAQFTRYFENFFAGKFEFVPGTFDYPTRAGYRDSQGNYHPDPRPFVGDPDANVLTLANYTRYIVPWYQHAKGGVSDQEGRYWAAYWYGPGPAGGVPRDYYANQVMDKYFRYQYFFGCLVTGP